MANKARTDIHRKGAIVPAHYTHVLSYSLSTTDGGWPIPAFRVNCELEGQEWIKDESGVERVKKGEHHPDGQCCVIGLRKSGAKFAEHGGAGKCTVCGACYVYGDVWRHENGEHIHVGHDCAAKYELMVDRSEYELARGRMLAARAAEIARERNAEQRAAFLAEHPGLSEALKCEHYITRDLARKFQEYRSLSEGQIKLAFKLAEEAELAKVERVGCAEPPPVNVPEFEGRVVIEGRVLTTKVQEGFYGSTLKMLLAVRTPEGQFKLWGTVPSGFEARPERGAIVRVKAGVERSKDDPTFGFMSRPTVAKEPKPKARKAA